MKKKSDDDLSKLQKLKSAIQKDYEKKTGKKRETKKDEKKTISLSDSVRKRLSSKRKSTTESLKEINTFIDVERKGGDISISELRAALRNNIDNASKVLERENLNVLLELVNEKVDQACKHLSDILRNGKKDYVVFNYFFVMIVNGKELDKELIKAFRAYPDSIYPFMLLVFYSIYHSGNYRALKGIAKLIERKQNPLIVKTLSDMIKHYYLDITKDIGMLYRQTQFREFQNTAGALAYVANSDEESYRRLLKNLEKKQHHHCSKLYYEYLSREEINTEQRLNQCPFGKFMLAKRLLLNGDKASAKHLIDELKLRKDPHGQLLEGSIAYAEGDEAGAYKIWFEAIKNYTSVMIGKVTHSESPYKRLGLGRTGGHINMENIKIPDNVATFKSLIENKLSNFQDIEFFLYPFEELRTVFGPHACQLYYSHN